MLAEDIHKLTYQLLNTALAKPLYPAMPSRSASPSPVQLRGGFYATREEKKRRESTYLRGTGLKPRPRTHSVIPVLYILCHQYSSLCQKHTFDYISYLPQVIPMLYRVYIPLMLILWKSQVSYQPRYRQQEHSSRPPILM